MKKTNNLLQIILAILFIFICVILIFGLFFPMFDELWNFQNVFKIYNGFKIYKDSNVIITPLFFYLENIIFHIFTPTILIFRITSVFILIAILYILYKIAKNLKISKSFAILYLSITLYEYFELFTNGANYNMFAEIFFLIGLSLYVQKKSSNLLQGILLFIIFFTKQNLGVYYFLAIVAYELYLYKFNTKFFINQVKKVFVFLVPSLVLIFIYWINGTLPYFINYTIGGIFEFSKYNFCFTFEKVYAILYSTILFVLLMVLKKKLLKNTSINQAFFDNVVLIFIFSISFTLIAYPLFNPAHFVMSFPLHYLLLLYVFDTIIIKGFFEDKKDFSLIFYTISTVILLYIVISNLYSIFNTDYNELDFISDKSSPYFGLYMDKDIENKIETLKNYIQRKNNQNIEVVICSYESAQVMIPLKQSHGVYDLLFYGNLGFNGIEKIKKDILNKENIEYLVFQNEDDMFGQEVKEIRDFIMDNLTRRGEILNYYVYSK